jgi:hypothetical protein
MGMDGYQLPEATESQLKVLASRHLNGNVTCRSLLVGDPQDTTFEV